MVILYRCLHVLEMCPYQRGVCIRERSSYQRGEVSEKCPHWRFVRIGEVSVLEREVLYQIGVCIREQRLERCLYQRGFCIREVSVLERCLYQRGVCIREMYVLKSSPYQRGVLLEVSCITDVSISERHPYPWKEKFNVLEFKILHSKDI